MIIYDMLIANQRARSLYVFVRLGTGTSTNEVGARGFGGDASIASAGRSIWMLGLK